MLECDGVKDLVRIDDMVGLDFIRVDANPKGYEFRSLDISFAAIIETNNRFPRVKYISLNDLGEFVFVEVCSEEYPFANLSTLVENTEVGDVITIDVGSCYYIESNYKVKLSEIAPPPRLRMG